MKGNEVGEGKRFWCAHWAILALAAIVVVALFQENALAGQGLPYEDGITKFKESLTGPVAQGIAIAGIFVCGGTLIFGGDLPNFVRQMCLVVLVLALLVCGNTVLDALYEKKDSKGAILTEVSLPGVPVSALPNLRAEAAHE